MTPEEIETHQFTVTRLKSGYDADEVDHFLDRLAVDYRQALRELGMQREENARLRLQLAGAQDQLAEAPVRPSEAAGRILEAAQKAADDVVEDARTEAAAIVNRATVEADDRRRQVQSDAYATEARLKELQNQQEALRSHLRAFTEKMIHEL